MPAVAHARSLSWILAAVFVGGCSADAVEEPIPTLETTGAFTARLRSTEATYQLFRTRLVLAFDPERTYIVFDEHFAGARDLAEARRKAQDPELQLDWVGPIQRSQFVRAPYEVVWYRTLTEEERTSNGGL